MKCLQFLGLVSLLAVMTCSASGQTVSDSILYSQSDEDNTDAPLVV
jgi:hypothetical protein